MTDALMALPAANNNLHTPTTTLQQVTVDKLGGKHAAVVMIKRHLCFVQTFEAKW